MEAPSKKVYTRIANGVRTQHRWILQVFEHFQKEFEIAAAQKGMCGSCALSLAVIWHDDSGHHCARTTLCSGPREGPSYCMFIRVVLKRPIPRCQPMSKRSLASDSVTSPRKRKSAKPSSNQASLDSFFKSRGTANRKAETVPSGDEGRSGTHGATIVSDSDFFSDIAADEALARRLAEEDGIDVDMLRRMETSAKRTSQAGPSKAVSRQSPEIIDVDLLDDSAQATEPSGSQPAGKSTFKLAARSAEVSAKSASSIPDARDHTVAARRGLATTAEASTNPQYSPLDVDPVTYPLDDCPWKTLSAPYSFLAHALATLSGTRSRIAIMNVLTNALRTVIKFHPASLRSTLYLLSNALSPPYSTVELGLGPSVLSKAIQDVSGLTASALRRLYNSTGDPGK